MFKKTLIALGTVAIVSAGALPALAATDQVFNVPTGTQLTTNQIDLAEANVQTLLNQRGIHATDVNEWGGYIRANVTQPDGSQSVQFFDPDTLAPVSINDLH